MPDRHVHAYHLAGKFAPWAGTVHNIVKFIILAVVCLKAFYFIALFQNFRHLYAGLDNSAVFLHLLCVGVGDHGSVKVSVILCVACAQDIVCGDVRKDFLDSVLVRYVLACIAGCLCQGDTCLNGGLYLLICCDHQSTCFIKSGGTLFLCFHL